VIVFFHAIILAAIFAMVWIVHSVIVHFYIVMRIRAAPVVGGMSSVLRIAVVGSMASSVVLLGLGIREAEGHEK